MIEKRSWGKKRFFMWLIVLVAFAGAFVLGGCPVAANPSNDNDANQPAAQEDESDFMPASGKANDGVADAYGPWNLRLRTAVSQDGVSWTKSKDIVTDQADVPCLIVKDGTLWLFYVIWHDKENTAGFKNTAVAAYTKDFEHWIFKKLVFSGIFPEGFTKNPVDPTVVLDQDGLTYRMYFTLGQEAVVNGKIGTFSATSTDLIHWTFEGQRYVFDDKQVLDPNLLWVGDHYEFFAGGSPPGNHHATSTDGLNLTTLANYAPQIEVDGKQIDVVLSNGMKVGSTYKYFGFLNLPASEATAADIRSFTYDTAVGTWSLDDDARLEVDESDGKEAKFVKDPAVSIHPAGKDAGYVMVYVTAIP